MPPADTSTDAQAGALIAAGTARLRSSGSPTPRLDAELLVAHAFGRDRAWLIAHPEAVLDPDPAADLDASLARRATGEPIAYLRGFKEWLSLRVRTDPRALIPRPETELLATTAVTESAERLTRSDAPVVVWDVGTGSGAVALALALRFRAALALGRMRLVASDLSADALELAAENLATNGVSDLVTLVCADLLAPAGESLPKPDVVVANPPYLNSAEVDRGAGSIAYEPQIALDGGRDGLDVVRRLIAEVPRRLASGGVCLVEVGAGQADAVRTMLPADASVSTLADLAGVERVVRAHLA